MTPCTVKINLVGVLLDLLVGLLVGVLVGLRIDLLFGLLLDLLRHWSGDRLLWCGRCRSLNGQFRISLVDGVDPLAGIFTSLHMQCRGWWRAA